MMLLEVYQFATGISSVVIAILFVILVFKLAKGVFKGILSMLTVALLVVAALMFAGIV